MTDTPPAAAPVALVALLEQPAIGSATTATSGKAISNLEKDLE